jgi:hypothetical protein
LATDLGEAHDVAAQHPDLVARARGYLDQSHVPSALWPIPAR